MKLKGFTLAEVLIVIAVLGVVAALTLPAINSNVQKQQVGPALMRAIGTLDTANALMMEEQDFYTFRDSCINQGTSNAGYVTKCFKPYIMQKIGAAEDNTPIEYDYIGYVNVGHVQGPVTLGNGNGIGFVTNNGYKYYLYDNDGNTPYQFYIYALVDVNGSKRPNTFGKDLFAIWIDIENDGKIIANGSRTDGISSDHKWFNEDMRCDSVEVKRAETCSGSIVDNGGRVIYPWN